jgi:single-strand DNA-binding protein
VAGTYNRITIIGNLGRDPETRMLPSGDSVTSFTVATTERSKNGDVTTWFNVSAFAKLAEVCEKYLHKGSYVYIEGPLTQREYTNREGQVRQSLDVRAREMRMLDKAGENRGDYGGGDFAAPAASGAGSSRPAPAATFDDNNNMDDIPF